MSADGKAGTAGDGDALKVMLVDDEYMVLDTLVSTVRWRVLGMEVVATAINGRHALEKCALHKPDLIVTDLTMPVMDGLELMATLRRDFPGVRFAVLTAHQEFAYAKRAVDMNALGYLLKTPMNAEEIETTLRSCGEAIRAERRLHSRARFAEQMMEQIKWDIRRRLLDDLLRGTHVDGMALAELFPWQGRPGGERPAVVAVYATLLQRGQFYARYPEADWPLLDYAMLQAAGEMLQELTEGAVLPYRSGETMLVLAVPAHAGEAQRASLVQQLHGRLAAWLQRYFGVALAFGVGSARTPDIAALRATLQEAIAAADAAFYEPAAVTPYIDGLTKVWDRAGPRDWAVLEAELRAAWRSPAVEERLGGLRALAAFARSFRPRPRELRRQAAMWLEETAAVPLARGDWVPLEDNSSLEQWLAALEAQLVRLPRPPAAAGAAGERHPDIRKAIAFILQHLGENVTLSRVAEHVHMNPSYLSHLFKEETGENFLDFVTLQRIEQAKRYLAAGSCKNYELAEKIGFVSYPHFCTVFKKVTGLTPNEYKRSLLE
ncbi:response regulator transcription factor [Paenibacillus cymbidii]|uniref:response regulator transcription factor n=1 Tax=Paenibacillus cymbidii TaxID=1639034 RepID=UPI00107FE914|nr:response regulator [Paenibacillus cymbidii]